MFGSEALLRNLEYKASKRPPVPIGGRRARPPAGAVIAGASESNQFRVFDADNAQVLQPTEKLAGGKTRCGNRRRPNQTKSPEKTTLTRRADH